MSEPDCTVIKCKDGFYKTFLKEERMVNLNFVKFAEKKERLLDFEKMSSVTVS